MIIIEKVQKATISDNRFVNFDWSGLIEATVDEFAAEDYNEQDAAICLNGQLDGKTVDLSQWLSKDDIQNYVSLSVCYEFKTELEQLGYDEDEFEDNVLSGEFKVEEGRRFNYGTDWTIVIGG